MKLNRLIFQVIGILCLMGHIGIVQESSTGQLAFLSKNGNGSELHIINADGTNQHRVTNNLANNLSAAWSPNGKQIAFISFDAGLYVVDVDGSTLYNLIGNACCYSVPTWSPDGTKIAFGAKSIDKVGIFIINSDGTNEHILLLSSLTLIYAPTSKPIWSPDGKQIAFIASSSSNNTDNVRSLYIINADGTDLHPPKVEGLLQDFPAWSPDNTKIAFDGVSLDGQWYVYVMNKDGSNLRHLAPALGNSAPVWSPDGTKIAFVSDNGNGGGDISVIDIINSKQHRLTNGSYNNNSPAWSPDGNYIAYDSVLLKGSEVKGVAIFIMRADGSNPRQVTADNETNILPIWSPILAPPTLSI